MTDAQTKKPKVAMLTGHSLFADGLASKLREYSTTFEIRIFDDQPDVVAELAAFRPLAVILEDDENRLPLSYSLQKLFLALPGLLIVFLNIAKSQIIVIHGEQYAPRGAVELIEIIQRNQSDPARQIQQELVAR